ncbi:hypothetical protein P43SY_002014 [Pythium insidiosum]|uniref:Reverse transcriptase domain-containing protein n=1 Tax=Pythium insidiosum TaxID=114742 RepID=A0AAD5LU73_PYTIN|nr:hypothetical protein P43SY_002014 [Pythium insidiosum]
MSGPPPTPRSLGFSIRNVVLREYDPGRDGLVDVWIQSVRKAIAADEAMMGGRFGTKLDEIEVVERLAQRNKRVGESYAEQMGHYARECQSRYGAAPTPEGRETPKKTIPEPHPRRKTRWECGGDRSAFHKYRGDPEQRVRAENGAQKEFIVGSDYWTSRRATISYETCEATFMDEDTRVIVPFTFDGAKAGAIRLARGYKVATQTQRLLRVPAVAPEGSVGLFLPGDELSPRLLVPPTLATVRGGQVTVPVLNVLGQKAKLPARTQLGRWVPLDADVQVVEAQGGLQRDAIMRWIDSLNRGDSKPLPGENELILDHLSRDEKDMLLRTLRCFPRVVSTEQVCPPPTDTGVQHHIPTDRRGPWCFPVVLVKKKDGSVRFCVDYRALNDVTAKDVYPLPRIDETVEALGGATRFSTMDLMAGYWQIPVAPGDRDKTAFATRQGLFRFRRMPFGLTNAPGTFQRLMDCVLRGLSWICCLVYLDDIIVYSRGPMEAHVVRLAAVLARLEDAGLTIKLKKCVFGANKVEYLGHELDAECVRPTERLLRAIRDAPAPTDQTGVRCFVHLAGNYRRFIPDFGRKAEPMTRLLRKGVPWQWREEQVEAFQHLKRDLTEKPVLVYPDFGRPFVLATDASIVGLGAALMQDHELECLAVIWAINQFRPYLYGREFQVITDHAALKWLMTKRETSARLHRWALALQEYNFVVVYRPGRSNGVPDALSRAPVKDCGSRTVRPTKVIPPLRSIRVGDVCDRWALDIAGPLPRTAKGNRYIVAAVEEVSKELTWVFKPTRGPGVSKLRHRWIGPCKIVEPAGYESFWAENQDIEGDVQASAGE